MKNISRLLQEIKANPIQYLDKPSITSLDMFLCGYVSERADLGLDKYCDSELFGFQEWIQEREKITLTQSWAGILLFTCGSERNAFYSFFEIFERFLKQKDSSKPPEIINTNENNISRYHFDIYQELLGSVKKRPGMYLGRNSITRIEMVLRGCSFARREAGVPPTEPEKEFAGFESWIQEKYEIKTGQSWAKIILFFSVDEVEELQKFFELFEEYLNRNKNSENVV
jgi:hypothetical protein